MNHTGSPIALETKQKARTDFVLGRGSLRTIAKRYDLANGTIQGWAESEEWTKARDLFASQDELTECKRQLIQLNAAIEAAGQNAENLHLLLKSKAVVSDIYFRLTQFPRCPIAKPEKPKSNELFRRLELAAKAQEREDRGRVTIVEPAAARNSQAT
jgi:hypothetical protein